MDHVAKLNEILNAVARKDSEERDAKVREIKHCLVKEIGYFRITDSKIAHIVPTFFS